MTIREIRAMPVMWNGGGKIHESTLRSFHTVRQIRYWLEKKVPPDIILELIDEIEEKP